MSKPIDPFSSIPLNSSSEITINYNKDDNTLEVRIPRKGEVFIEFNEKKISSLPDKIEKAFKKLGQKITVEERREIIRKIKEIKKQIKEIRKQQKDFIERGEGRGVEKKEPTILSHINEIENPEYYEKPVVAEGVIASTSIAYLVPKEVKGRAYHENEVEEKEKIIEIDDPINIQLVGVNEETKQRRLKRFLRLVGEAIIEEKSHRIVYRLRVRPPVFTLEKKGDKIVDEKGYEYKAFEMYIVSEKPLNFQPSTLIRVVGIPIAHPKTQQVTLLAYNVEFPEEVQTFDIEKLKMLQEKFKGKSPKERLEWILENFEIYSRIKGRRNLALAGFLAFFSPLYICFNGEIQRGWIIVLIIGDSTTGKSETVRKLIRLLKQGVLITAETASTVGLTGTAIQIEKEGWMIDWGLLVLQDRKLLAIDGAHKLSSASWAALAESERSGKVIISKAAKNEAYARTRQIKIANPIDREVEKYTTKTLSSFLYPCQAVSSVFDKTTIARIDLVVFSSKEDVNIEEINKLENKTYDPALECFSEVLKWAWSNKVKVIFTQEAIEEILKKSTELYKLFSYEEIPLVDVDMKYKLARLSAAMASLTLSTEDFQKVIVTKEHVDLVVDFIKEEYSRAGLNILAQTSKHETLDVNDVKEIVESIEKETQIPQAKICDILRFIVLKGRVTRDILRTEFSLAEKNELRPLIASLRNKELIEERKGFYATSKLIKAYKVSNGFNLPSLPKLPTSEENPPARPGVFSIKCCRNCEEYNETYEKCALYDSHVSPNFVCEYFKEKNTVIKPSQELSLAQDYIAVGSNFQSENEKQEFFICKCGCGPWRDINFAIEHLLLFKGDSKHEIEKLKAVKESKIEGLLECRLCNIYFASEYDLEAHMKALHSEVLALQRDEHD